MAENKVKLENPKEPTDAEILGALNNLTKKVVDAMTYINNSSQQMISNINNISTNHSLRIGREAVQPLIEVKTLATQVCAAVHDRKTEMLLKVPDLEPVAKYLDELWQQQKETDEFIKYSELTMEAFNELKEQQKKQRENVTSGNDLTVSSDCDPSTSGFSLFNSSDVNIATSSPILETESPKKEQE